MTVTWTSGYSEKEARPIIAWKWEEESDWKTSLAITLTYEKSDMCGECLMCVRPPEESEIWGFLLVRRLKFVRHLISFLVESSVFGCS